MFVKFFILIATVFLVISSQAQTFSLNLEDVPLEKLLADSSSVKLTPLENLINSKEDVSTASSSNNRKSPSIISIITDIEIQKFGCRNMIDILKLVPGVDFNLDVEGVVGISIRGLWGHEGKVLVLVDGMQQNELAFGTASFGDNFNIHSIKRIEVIRGPGSVTNGGFAEYAVINVITQNGKDLSGVSATGFAGLVKDGVSKSNLSVGYGINKNDLDVSIKGYYSNSVRGNGIYRDATGKQFDMFTNSDLHTLNGVLNIKYKKLKINAFMDESTHQTRAYSGDVLSKPYNESFDNITANVSYDFSVGNKITITPKFSYRNSSPYKTQINQADTLDNIENFKIQVQRYNFNLISKYKIGKKSEITLGGDFFTDYCNKQDATVFRNSRLLTINYFNASGFVQGVIRTKIGNINLGARYDYNNSFGEAFVPRLAYTNKFGKFGLKLQYAQSFRAPNVMDVQTSLNNQLKPETSQTIEVELNYELARNTYFTINAFDITTKNSIIYFLDTSIKSATQDGYFNSLKTGSQGLEFGLRHISKYLLLNCNYSFYTTANKTSDAYYKDDYTPKRNLGLATHKLSLASSFNITPSLYVSPSLFFYSKRSAVNSVDTLGDFYQVELPESYFINLNIGYNDLFIKGFNVSCGIYNLMNAQEVYIQPYAAGHTPLNGLGREFIFKLTYCLSFFKK